MIWVSIHSVILFFSVFFNVLQGSIIYYLFFLIYTQATYQIIQSTAIQLLDDVLSFITHSAET